MLKFTPEIEIYATFAPTAREPFLRPRPAHTETQGMPNENEEDLETIEQRIREIPHPPPPTIIAYSLAFYDSSKQSRRQ